MWPPPDREAGSSRGGDELDGTSFPCSIGPTPRTMEDMADLDIDVQSLPQQVSPPDHWQERAACYGLDPGVFFPTTEEEASLALSYCGGCRVPGGCPARGGRNGGG